MRDRNAVAMRESSVPPFLIKTPACASCRHLLANQPSGQWHYMSVFEGGLLTRFAFRVSSALHHSAGPWTCLAARFFADP